MTDPIRLLDASHADAMDALNLDCPIRADFTFCFDRRPDFLGWPEAIYDRFQYAGTFDKEELVSFGIRGEGAGWVGGETGRWFYLGDGRTHERMRGQKLIRKIGYRLLDELDPDIGIGFCLVKEGNTPAERVVNAAGRAGFWIEPLCRFDAVNLLLLKSLGKPRSCKVRRATAQDVPAMTALMRSAWRHRLFAPDMTDARLRHDLDRWPGYGLDRFYLAERDGQLVGLLAAWDAHELKRTLVQSYSMRGQLTRFGYGLVRLFARRAAPLPARGGAFRALHITRMAIEERDPDILRDLLRAVAADHHGAGYHMLHVGLCGRDPLMGAFRRWPVQHFRSRIHLIGRDGARWREILRWSQDPWIDIVLI